MNKFLVLSMVGFLAVIIEFSSCSPAVYSNVGQNVPLLKNKGEVSIMAGLAATEHANGVAVNGGFAVDSSWAILGSLYKVSREQDGGSWYGRGSLIELGTGTFGKFDNSNFIYEIYGGLGFANIINKRSDGARLKANFIKPFIQPSLGYAIQNFEFAFTPRLALVNYTFHDYSLSQAEHTVEAARFFADNKTKVVFEPGVTLRFGVKGVMFHANYAGSTFSPEGSNNEFGIGTAYLGVGMRFLISKRYLRG